MFSSLSSNSGCIPGMSTNPPNGMALTPHSIPVLSVLDHIVGPNPTKYLVGFIPVFLATHQCPSSCAAMLSITNSMNSIKESMGFTVLI